MARHPLAFPDARRKGRCTDRAWRAMKHGTVRGAAAAKMMPFHKTCETASLAGRHHVHALVRLKDIDHDLVAWAQVVFTFQMHFPQHAHRRLFGLLEMTVHRLVYSGWLDKLHKSELYGLVPVFLRRLPLNDHAWTGLDDRDWNGRSVVLKELGHP